MKRYVSVRRSAAGATSVTVSLVDGELSARYTSKTYLGHIEGATSEADAHARQALDEVRKALEPAPLGATA